MHRPSFLAAGILFLAATSALSQDKVKIQVGSKSFTENVILGEMLIHLAESAGHPVRHKPELGSRIAYEALKLGDLDVYPEYSGTLTGELLQGKSIRSEKDLEEALAADGIRMSKRLGFVNSYALGMKRSLAEKLKLKSIADLARTDDPQIAKLRCGFSDEFMLRGDGWPKLQERYRLPQNARGMNHQLAYQGLNRGAIDITDIFSTDAEIEAFDLVVLEDNLGYFPVYDSLWLYRADLEQRAPGFVAAIQRLEGIIDNPTMIDLNARVLIDRQSESQVAANFLNEKLDLKIPPPPNNRGRLIAARLWKATWQHLILVAGSLLAAILIGLPLGVAAGKARWLGQPILAAVGIIQTIPSMAVLVLMVPLFGIGVLPASIAIFLYSLLPIVRGVYAGLKEIPPNLRESALVLGLPPMTRLWQIELPLASRSIFSGIKTSAVINVGTATLGGLIAAGGYGEIIFTGLRLVNTSLILQGAIPAAVMALVVQMLFELSERWFVPAGLRT